MGKPQAADRTGDVIDIEAYYRRYGPMVLRRCRFILKNEEKAQDAMQEVFVNLLKHRQQLSHSYPSSLLYRMATNVCLNQIRYERRRPQSRNDSLLDLIADHSEVEERVAASGILDKLFRREKESTRTIAMLHLVDGLTLEETAREVSMSVSGVRKRLRQLKGRAEEMAAREV